MYGGKYLKNILELVFQPKVSQALTREFNDIRGIAPVATTLTTETTVSWDGGQTPFIALTTGAQNITINAVVTGLRSGQRVYLRLTQGATARTVTWGTNIKSDVTVTATAARTDMLVGVFDGTRIMLGALAQNLTL